MENQQGALRGTPIVAAGEAKICAEKDRKRDKYLRKKYFIGLDFYNSLGEFQGWRCGICGRHQSEFSISLAVDHKHFKIMASPTTGEDALLARGLKWRAETTVQGHRVVRLGRTKAAAIQSVKEDAMPLSIRGLLCPGRHGRAGQGCCNRLLGHVDEPWWLEAADRYLKNPPAILLDKTSQV